MSWRRYLRRRFWHRERAQEIAAHLEIETADNMARGMTPNEARQSALRRLGNPAAILEDIYRMNSIGFMESLWGDIRYGVRMLAKNAGVTATIVLTLAIAIGANTAIFSVVYGVLLRPLPYQDSNRIVSLWEANAKGHRTHFSDPNFDDLQSLNHVMSGMAKYGSALESVSGGTDAARVTVTFVSGDFFSILGVQPVFGRGFVAGDHASGAPPVALVSYPYWQQYLSGVADLSGCRLRMDDTVYTVVGVLPSGFRFASGADLWVPGERFREPSRTAHNWSAIGKIRGGVTLAQARSDLSAIARRLKQQYGRDTSMSDAAVIPLRESLTGGIRPALLVLLGAVGFLLLGACANVANLLLSQASVRERELAIRTALGASRGRLVRQLLNEVLLLSLLGGSLGVASAVGGLRALLALAPKGLPRLDEVSVNVPVLLFALGVTITVAAGLGILAALRATSGQIRGTLNQGGRSQVGGPRAHHLGSLLVAAQFAIALILLVGAGLLGRSLFRVLTIDPGFRTGGILTMDLAMPSVRAGRDAELVTRAAFLRELMRRLRAIPGVDLVGGVNIVPLDGGLYDGTFIELSPQEAPKRMADFDPLFHDTSRTGDANYCVADAGYFRVLGIPLKRGRLFDDRDGPGAPHAAVISESLARAKWPGADPIGRTIEFGNMDGDLRVLTIVGVVGDIRESSLEAPPRPTIYVSYSQRPERTETFTLVMRSDAAPGPVFAAARGVIRDLAPDAPPRFRTFQQIYAASLGSRRFNLVLVVVFAAAALVLALAGVYGVIAYSVNRRRREIGVRIALGATGADVLSIVLAHGMFAAAAGLVIGIGGSIALNRAIESLLFGVSATDPGTFAMVSLVLLAVALAACYVPAHRALRIDPMEALRFD